MKRRLIFVIIIIIMLGLIAYFYINTFLLPIKFKQFAESKAQDILKRKVSIEKVSFDFVRGFNIHGFKAFREDDPSRLFIEIANINFNILFASFLKDKTIFIPHLKIRKPFLYVSRYTEKGWNISDILSSSDKSKEKNAPLIVIKKVSLEHGEISYLDRTQDKELLESIKNINILVSLSLEKIVAFAFDSYISSPQSKVKATGEYALGSKAISSRLVMENINVAEYLSSFIKSNVAHFKNGVIAKTDLNILYNDKNVNVTGNLDIANINISTSQIKQITGNISSPDISFSWDNKKLTIRGAISSPNIVVQKDNTMSIAGNVDASIRSLTLLDNSASFHGDLSLNNGMIAIAKNKFISGDINTSNLTFSNHDNTINITGDLTSHNTHLKLSDNNYIKSSLFSAKNSRVTYEDDKLDIHGYFLSKDSDIFIKDHATVKGNINAENTSTSIYQGGITVESQLQIANANISLADNKNLSGNITAKHSSLFFKDKKLSITSAIDISQAKVFIDKNKTFSSNLSADKVDILSDGETFGINLSLKTTNTVANFDDKTFLGNPFVEGSYTFDPNAKNIHTFSGKVLVENSSLSGLPHIGTTEKLKGILTINNFNISTSALSLSSNNGNYILSGSISNLQDPEIDVSISTENLETSLIHKFFSQQMKDTGISLKGPAALKLKYQGSLFNFDYKEISASTKLKKVNISHRSIKDKISDISGNINYQNNLIVISELKGSHKNKAYTLNGKIENFSRPTSSYQVTSDDLSLSAKMNILNGAVQFDLLDGKYYNTSFDFIGDIHFVENSSPKIDLRGNFVLDTNDMLSIVPSLHKKLRKLNVSSIIYGSDFLFKGHLDDWENWDLTFKATTPSLNIYNYPFRNTSISYDQRDNTISRFNITTSLYNGNLEMLSSVNLLEQDLPFKANTSLSNIDLAAWKKDKNIKITGLQGKLSATANTNGPLFDITKMQGTGSFATTDAFLGKIEIVQGLLSVINRVPGTIGSIIKEVSNQATSQASKQTRNYIKDAAGNFSIKSKRIFTDNLNLTGTLYDLSIHGSIGFDMSINAIVSPDHSRFVGQNKLATEFIGSPIQVEVSGSIKHPSYKPIINPVKPIEAAVGTTFELLKEVGGLFGGFLD